MKWSANNGAIPLRLCPEEEKPAAQMMKITPKKNAAEIRRAGLLAGVMPLRGNFQRYQLKRFSLACLTIGLLLGASGLPSLEAQQQAQVRPQELLSSSLKMPLPRPWMNAQLSPENRVALILKQMTLDEKILLLHGVEAETEGSLVPSQINAKVTSGAVGYVPGIERLGIPCLQIADAALGVTKGAYAGRYSTPMPSTLSDTSAWDKDLSYQYGVLLGRELRDAGFNMSLAGGVNLARDPRNGRNFEYRGEDPVLAGILGGEAARGVQSQGVIGDIKHFAFNDQETDRTTINVTMDRRTMRETDLLAFELGIRNSGVNSVMCAYNKVDGDYACESAELLNDLLKRDLNFQGFVISDWKATHTTAKAANAGLDMQMPNDTFFGEPLKKAVADGNVSEARIDDMAGRILRAEFAAGLFDRKPVIKVTDVEGGMALAQRVAEEGSVLLKNDGAMLPLRAEKIRSVLLIGGHADVGVLTGGGSSRVDGPGGSAIPMPDKRSVSYFHSSPLQELQARLPKARIRFDEGADVAKTVALARDADVVIVFAVQPSREGLDHPTLSLPDRQDELIAAVAAANAHTVVVLETGDPVTMPWLAQVPAVLEAWYPGIHGAQAIANLLTGASTPSGKLAITFPAVESDLPHSLFAVPSDAHYTEALKVGYKWYDAENKKPLFAFGYGLSYTTFAYSALKTSLVDKTLHAHFVVKNTGDRAGAEIAEVYVSLPDGTGEPPKRLVGWQRVMLAPHESRDVDVEIEPLMLSVFDTQANHWSLTPGQYVVRVGGSSQALPLQAAVTIR